MSLGFGHKERGFCSLLFRWESDRKNVRLVLSAIPDLRGRNVMRFGNSVVHYPRWVEMGFLAELLRLTDYLNSLNVQERESLIELTSLSLFRPSEEIVSDLWEVARFRLPLDQFLKKFVPH